MDHHHRVTRVLAVEVRGSRFGFVILEGPTQVLEWGGCSLLRAADASLLLKKKIKRLFALFHPTAVVVKSMRHKRDPLRKRIAPILHMIEEETAQRSATFAVVQSQVVRRTFRASKNKSEIAALIAEYLPPLAWVLPPKRTYPKPEHYNTLVFDAAALGLTYFVCLKEMTEG